MKKFFTTKRSEGKEISFSFPSERREKALLTTKRSEGKEISFSFPSERREKSLFTPTFFKFLLGFSAMILVGFAVITLTQ